MIRHWANVIFILILIFVFIIISYNSWSIDCIVNNSPYTLTAISWIYIRLRRYHFLFLPFLSRFPRFLWALRAWSCHLRFLFRKLKRFLFLPKICFLLFCLFFFQLHFCFPSFYWFLVFTSFGLQWSCKGRLSYSCIGVFGFPSSCFLHFWINIIY